MGSARTMSLHSASHLSDVVDAGLFQAERHAHLHMIFGTKQCVHWASHTMHMLLDVQCVFFKNACWTECQACPDGREDPDKACVKCQKDMLEMCH